MVAVRCAAAMLASCWALSFAGETLAQRVRSADKAAPPANAAQAPTAVGQVVGYEPEKSIALETRNRNVVSRSEFVLSKDRTKIDLPPRMMGIKVGATVAVWADANDPKLAARIGLPSEGGRGNRRPASPPDGNGGPAGTPARPVVKSDAGTERAVRRKAPTVPDLTAAEVARRIDDQIHARLSQEKVPASPQCDDAEFVRRVYLDLHGVIPPAEKAAAF